MIAITGATGKTGEKLARLLLDKNVKIRAVGRSLEKLSALRDKGAEVAVGDQADSSFLTKAFAGCESVYLLIPPKMDSPDVRKYYNIMGDAAIEAVRKNGVEKVVFLSSLGAELDAGTGPVVGLHDVEAKLEKLNETTIAFLRAGYFMENTLMNASLIKTQGINGNSTPPDAPIAMVASHDIAKKAAELLTDASLKGHVIVDLFSERISYKEATKQIGEAIGIPGLTYVQFPDTEAIKAMTSMGVSANLAQAFVELSAALGKGRIMPTQIDPLKPNGETKFKTFAKEVFEPVYKKA